MLTISDRGMYSVDAFNAFVNPARAAIPAVGHIADRVVAVNGLPAVQPTMDPVLRPPRLRRRPRSPGRGALAGLIEEPLALLL